MDVHDLFGLPDHCNRAAVRAVRARVQCTWDVTQARGLYFKRAAPRSAEQPFSGRDAVQCAIALLVAILLFAGWMAVLGSGYFGDAPPYRLRRDMF